MTSSSQNCPTSHSNTSTELTHADSSPHRTQEYDVIISSNSSSRCFVPCTWVIFVTARRKSGRGYTSDRVIENQHYGLNRNQARYDRRTCTSSNPLHRFEPARLLENTNGFVCHDIFMHTIISQVSWHDLRCISGTTHNDFFLPSHLLVR